MFQKVLAVLAWGCFRRMLGLFAAILLQPWNGGFIRRPPTGNFADPAAR